MLRLRIQESTWAELLRALFVRTDVETAGLLLAEPLVSSEGEVLVVREVAVIPNDGYVVREPDRIRIDPIALNRVARRARDRGWSIFTVHTHPGAAEPWFSWADDEGDRRLMPSFSTQIPGVPHGSLVVVPGGRALGRAFRGGLAEPLSIRVVGARLRALEATDERSSGAEESEEKFFHRQAIALGAAGQRAIARLRVGVVGLGGTGSVTAAQLAHMGVRRLVFVDGDVLEASNVSRVVGASAADVGKPKSVLKNYARAARRRSMSPIMAIRMNASLVSVWNS